MRRTIAVILVLSLFIININSVTIIKTGDTRYSISNTTLSPTAWVTYPAENYGTVKTGVRGVIALHDINIPDPMIFQWVGIWTHIAVAKNASATQYIVEAGIRKLKYTDVIWTPIGAIPIVRIYKELFITYYDEEKDKRTTVVIDGAELERNYFVKITKIASNVWLIGIYCPYNDKMYSYVLKSKNTYCTYYAFSQLEYYHYAGNNTIPETEGAVINSNNDLEWETYTQYSDYNGYPSITNFDNVDVIWTYDFYLTYVDN